MKLRRLRVERLPGIDRPFGLGPFESDVVLIVGPNGSGKSSICRAVRGTLWPDGGAGASVESEWEDEGRTYRATLEAGRVHWERDGAGGVAPALPDAHLAGCFTLGLRDLLGHDDAGRDIDGEVRRQLGGGYDLPAVRARFEADAKSSHGQRASRALAAATSARRQEERAQRELGLEQDRLAELRVQKESALRARRELEDWRKVGERAARLADCAQLDAELADRSPILSRFQGGELGTLEELERQLEKVRAACEETRGRIDAAERAQAQCALEHGPLDPAALARAREGVRRWARAEEQLDRARQEALQADAAARAARQGLADDGVAPGDAPPPVDADSLAQVEAWLQEHAEVAARRRELETRRSLLRGPEVPADAAERVRGAAEALRHWLSEPEPPPAWPAVGALVGAVASGAAAALALQRGPGPPWVWAGLASLAVVLLAMGLSLAIRPRGQRRRLEADWGRWECAPPETWTRAAVARRVEELDREQAELARRSDEAVAAERLDREIEALSTDESRIAQRRAEIAAGLGLDPGTGGLRLQDVARRVLRWREASDAARAAQAAAVECRAGLEAAAAEAAGVLAPWRPGAPPPASASEADAALDDLAARSESWRTAEALRSEKARQLEDLLADRRELDQRRREFLASLGLDAADPTVARHRLRALVEEWPDYKRLRERRNAAAREAEQLEVELADRAEWLALDREAADARRRAAEEAASRESELAAEIATIETRIRQASGTGTLEERLAAEEEAREALEAALDARLDAEAALWLLDGVQEEHDRHHSPAVLRQARSWFSAFTHHRYELAVDPRDPSAAFRALDVESGVRCRLHELSDGTRAQLWLAARLAFAARAERGSPLPLFLDEALTSSDPERFRAVVEGLLVLSSRGHQVFYLTCDPVDVEHWQALCAQLGAKPPAVVDLAAVRRGEASPRGPAALEPPVRTAVPAPEGVSAADYGTRLGVPLPRPFESARSWHLFHVLRDDIGLLHRILDGIRLDTVGQWLRARKDGATRVALAEEEALEVDARVDLALHFVEAWSIGRGRPLERARLEVSGSFNANRWLDEVDGLAARVGRDAAATVRALEAGSVTRFPKKAVADLRRELLEDGLIDERPVLDREAVRSRVLSLMEDPVGAGRIGVDEIHRRVDEWWAYLSGDPGETRTQS